MAGISVLMPVYNGCPGGNSLFLRTAIQSILQQTFMDFEMVIVDDGSTDDSPLILREYAKADPRVRIVSNPANMGLSEALNIGIRMIQTPLIARMDADDICSEKRLEIQKEFMDANPKIDVCGTWMTIIDDRGNLVTETERPTGSENIVYHLKHNGCALAHSSVVYRKESVVAAGLYNTSDTFRYAEDYELWVRMAAAGYRFENIPDSSLYQYRQHRDGSSAKNRLQQQKASRLIMSIAVGATKWPPKR